MEPTPKSDDIRAAIAAFLDVAFAILTAERVIPPSQYRAILEVGRDYPGSLLMPTSEFAVLTSALDRAFPERFKNPLTNEHPDFSQLWLFSLLRASIKRCSDQNQALSTASAGVDEVIEEYLICLGESEAEVLACRIVPHLSTESGAPTTIGDVTIYPDVDGREEIPKMIPGGASAFNGEPPFVYDHPHSLLLIRGSGPDAISAQSNLSRQLDRFLLLVRLLYASTAWTGYEVLGNASLVQPGRDRLTESPRSESMVRRVVAASAEMEPAFNGLARLIDEVNVVGSDMVFFSFDLALIRFSQSFESDHWYDQILGLTTALEAVISGTEKTDVILRLKSRAAALLADDFDNAAQIFSDISKLYELRSLLIHGGSLKMRKFENIVRKISGVPTSAMSNVAAHYAIDRLRDIVRRLILARLCLASGTDPVWPLEGEADVDASLADDETRELWRSTWRQMLTDLGASASASRASQAEDTLTPYSKTVDSKE